MPHSDSLPAPSHRNSPRSPAHLPLLLAALTFLAALIVTYVVAGKKHYLSVHNGFVEVLDDHVRVLADIAERAEEIDIERAKAALQRSQDQAINPALGVDPAEALAATMRAEARLATAEKK